jgi:hypothetical protein
VASIARDNCGLPAVASAKVGEDEVGRGMESINPRIGSCLVKTSIDRRERGTRRLAK